MLFEKESRFQVEDKKAITVGTQKKLLALLIVMSGDDDRTFAEDTTH